MASQLILVKWQPYIKHQIPKTLPKSEGFSVWQTIAPDLLKTSPPSLHHSGSSPRKEHLGIGVLSIQLHYRHSRSVSPATLPCPILTRKRTLNSLWMPAHVVWVRFFVKQTRERSMS